MLTISDREKQVRKRQQEAGIVSIIVATLLIIIVSLIVVAFAQISRREQRESLDAQLSAQAYYAAETGVNAARAVVQNLSATNPALLTQQQECQPTTGPFSAITYDLDPSSVKAVAITCLTVDPSPPFLSYTLFTDSAKVVPIVADSGLPIASLTFSWTKSVNNDTSGCRASQSAGAWSLPSETIWNSTWKCPFAAIRADFVPGGTLDRSFLLNNDKVSFMLPTTSGSGVGAMNDVSAARCDATNCSVTFNGLNYGSLYLRLISLYEGSETVTITGKDTNGTAINFTGAQAKIDSTGRAQDVLRRIVVSAPLQSGNDTAPTQALVSGDSVCKRFGVFSGFYLNHAPAGSGCE
jgi:hypothetical protein